VHFHFTFPSKHVIVTFDTSFDYIDIVIAYVTIIVAYMTTHVYD
jgi:hypothetical protein